MIYNIRKYYEFLILENNCVILRIHLLILENTSYFLIIENDFLIWPCQWENLPSGILLTVMLFAWTVTCIAFAGWQFYNILKMEYGCSNVVFSLYEALYLRIRNFSTVRYKILCYFENVQFFHKGGLPMDQLILENDYLILENGFRI